MMKRYKDEFKDMHRYDVQNCFTGNPKQAYLLESLRRQLYNSVLSVESELSSVPRILDAGCGNLGWYNGEVPTEYTGIDLHRRDNWEEWEAKGRTFIEGNFITKRLPKCDLIICRAVAYHLSNAALLRALRKFKSTGARYIYVNSRKDTNNESRNDMEDYSITGYPVNFSEAPFNLRLKENQGAGALQLFHL